MLNIIEQIQKRAMLPVEMHYSSKGRRDYGFYIPDNCFEMEKIQSRRYSRFCLFDVDSEGWTIVPTRFLYKREYLRQREDFLECNVCAVYSLGNIFARCKEEFCLVKVSNRRSWKVTFGILKNRFDDIDIGADASEHSYYVLNDYSNAESYFNAIEELENYSVFPDKPSEEFEIVEVSADFWERDLNCGRMPNFKPELYSRERLWYKESMNNSRRVSFADVADILEEPFVISRRNESDEYYKKYEEEQGRYFVITSSFLNGKKQNKLRISSRKPQYELQDGDILLPRKAEEVRFFLCHQYGAEMDILSLGDENEKVKVSSAQMPLYVSSDVLIIRPSDIDKDYLYMYLNSKLARTLLNAYSSDGKWQGVTKSILAGFEVIEPGDRLEFYQKQIASYYEDNIYEFTKIKNAKKIKKPQGTEREWKGTTDRAEDILYYLCLAKQDEFRDEKLAQFFAREYEELQRCEKARAYKAACIMLGSILEALMISWASFIDGEDYFKKEKRLINDKGKEYSASLVDYIELVRSEEDPRWDDEAELANKIRDTRNYVHPKKSMDKIVSEELYEELKTGLETIFESKYKLKS